MWVVRVASSRLASSARDIASRILKADLAQLTMILTTVVAGVTYGWIEGYVIRENLTNRSFTWLGHFSSYQVAVGILFGCITGGFALIQSRNMFARGNRYFLFAVIGNYPFAWLIEDFTYFLFNPLDALSAEHWTNWFLGGIYVYSPWVPGVPKPEFWVPTWYFLVFAWFLVCQFYAHRCTVYDNLVKDEICEQIVPKPIEIPSEPAPAKQVSPEATAETKAPSISPTHEAMKTKPARTMEAEEALERLRARVLKDA